MSSYFVSTAIEERLSESSGGSYIHRQIEKKGKRSSKLQNGQTNCKCGIRGCTKRQSETNWVVLKYEGNQIVIDSTGEDYGEFADKFSEDDRGFGFLRIETGDEMSKRKKFALITFIGTNVGPLQKAKVSTDKARVKDVFRSFAVEILTNEKSDLQVDKIKAKVVKAGGANYGTGC